MTTLMAGAVREAAHTDRGLEPEDFRRYVARRHLALLRTAYLLTGDHASAEDLVQTALARTWLAWGRIEDPRAVDAYVRRTLVNTHRSAWRRRRVKEVGHCSLCSRRPGRRDDRAGTRCRPPRREPAPGRH